jgi:parallel beta-helix repeat protein
MNKPFHRFKVLVGTLLAASLFAGCGNSENFVFTNTGATSPPPVVQGPVAVNDSFAALGNATLNQAATGVLANDTLNGGTITAFDATGNNGGTINLNADGSFTYTPATNFVGAETFAYTLSNAAGDSTATVTLTSTGLGRFVDNSGTNGTGTQASPFNNLQDALNAVQIGDTIYVARGDGTDTGVPGGFTLPLGVKLIGEGTGLILAQTIEPAGTPPVISGPITCMGSNLLQGFEINGSASDGIIINGVSDVTISQNSLSNITTDPVVCTDISGTVTIDGNVFEDAPGPGNNKDYINVVQTDTNASLVVTNDTFHNTAGASVDSLCQVTSNGTSLLNVTFSGNTAVGTIANEFNYGVYWENHGSADCSLTASGNNFSMFSNEAFGLYIYSTGATNATVTGNTMADCTYGIYLDFSNSVTVLSGNVLTNCGRAIQVFNGNGDGTCSIINNNVSGSTGIYTIEYETDASNLNAKLAIRDNTVTNSTNNAIDIFVKHTNNNVCCDITGNTVDKDMSFDDSVIGSLTVERFGDPNGSELKTVNTFNGGATVSVPNDAVVDAVAGFCAIP